MGSHWGPNGEGGVRGSALGIAWVVVVGVGLYTCFAIYVAAAHISHAIAQVNLPLNFIVLIVYPM